MPLLVPTGIVDATKYGTAPALSDIDEAVASPDSAWWRISPNDYASFTVTHLVGAVSGNTSADSPYEGSVQAYFTPSGHSGIPNVSSATRTSGTTNITYFSTSYVNPDIVVTFTFSNAVLNSGSAIFELTFADEGDQSFVYSDFEVIFLANGA